MKWKKGLWFAGVLAAVAIAAGGWFAARPSGTEEIYKIYAESFRGKRHLERIEAEAQAIVGQALNDAAGGDTAG